MNYDIFLEKRLTNYIDTYELNYMIKTGKVQKNLFSPHKLEKLIQST